jgi:methylmalonyl-CoA mutase
MPDEAQDIENITFEAGLNLEDQFPVPNYDQWRALAQESLKGASFEKKLLTPTYEEIDLKPIYTAQDREGLPFASELPGFGYYTRGTGAGGYINRPWEICQEIPAANAREFNEALKSDLKRGQTGITLDFQAIIATLEDLTRALDGIDIRLRPLHIIPGYSALEAAMMLKELAERQGVDMAEISGSIDADPLAYMVRHGELPIAVDDAFDRMARAVRWASDHAPRVKTVGISGLPYHDAGADAVRELAYVLATGVEYLDRLMRHGVPVDVAAGNMRFTFAVGPFFFMEIAKIRAARTLWAKITAACGAGENSRKMTIHARTSSYYQTRLDPYVNMLRSTTETFAAAAAGVDSIHTGSFDETFGPGGEFSRRTARNTQVLLNEECRVNRCMDPAGGSYFVETLTRQAAEKAWRRFQDIEARGGMLAALQEGFPQAEVSAVHEKRSADIARRKVIIVGSNFSANVNEKPAAAGGVKKKPGQSPSPAITPLEPRRAADMFEALRAAVDKHKEKTGSAPRVFLATMGPLSRHKARADFSQSFFEVGGFEVIYPNHPGGQGFSDAETAAGAAARSGAAAAVICSSDDAYPQWVPPLARALKKQNPRLAVVLAGFPKDHAESYKQAGVDEFIYLGADVFQVLSGILKQLGVIS